ncbi:MAG TPA: MalY/PatB family protein [Spirochaetales bacterium]|nr:MalY/PatB family protein [Spirochaetales bacterium]HQK35124.1 MalY/PatB family protein [Spirochaetales bacterium]HRV27339.1 MalY/PatB family protein [Spirochaetia bacterium]
MRNSMFDEIIDRKPFNSIKWSYLDSCGDSSESILPMWIADLDLPVHENIFNAIIRRAQHPIYGYAGLPEYYYSSFIRWMKNRHQTIVQKEWIAFSPGIVPALSNIIRKFSHPDDGIVIMPPVYHPFKMVIEKNGRTVREAPLINTNGSYTIDFDKLEQVSKGARIIILCSPHNPVGRVWTELELKSIADIACSHDLIVVSDEIHGDIVFSPNKQIPLFKADARFMDRTISCWAPSKTFNIPGLQTSYIIIPDKYFMEMYREELEASGLGVPNCFGPDAAAAAYEHGSSWLDTLLEFLKANHEYVRSYLAQHIPEITVSPAQGTYLAWLDFRALNITENLHDFLIHKAGLWLDAGSRFGTGGTGFMRMNIGCPRQVLDKALHQLKQAIKER